MSKLKKWNACDFLLLFGLVASIITLICTCTLVWNPYLKTSSFYWGNCWVLKINYTGYQACGKKSDDCVLPSPTLPPDWFTEHATSHMTPYSNNSIDDTSTTSSVTSFATDLETTEISITSSTSTEATEELLSQIKASRRRRRRDADEDYCISYPCVNVQVLYRNPNVLVTAATMMWNTYDDILASQQCSLSSCKDDNEKNFWQVYNFAEDMLNYNKTRSPFTCYLNYDNTAQILYHVNGTYAAAFSSIFWPIVGLICFFIGFLMYRFRGCMKKSRTPPSYEASYGVNGPNGGGQLSFVGVGEASGGNDYSIGGTASASPNGSEKNQAVLGQEMGGAARPDATAPSPMGTEPPPAYLEILPDGHYNFQPMPPLPGPRPAEDDQGIGLDNPLGVDTTDERY